MTQDPTGCPRKLSRRTAAQQLLAAAGALALRPTAQLFAEGAAAEPESSTGAGSLKAHALAHGLLTGAAVNVPLLQRDPVYRDTLIAQYNIVVAENAMKWAGLRPGPDTYHWDEADAFVQFARAHGMQIRGHNLCWHEALPAWFASTVNKGNAENYLTSHIRTVVGRYRGKIRAWDVVNEAIDPKDGQPDGYRNGPWYKLLGPRFLDIAFRTAHEADPGAILTYNDYSLETDGKDDTAKREAIAALVTRLHSDGVPIGAMGVQSHISAASAGQIGAGLSGFVDRMQALGLKVFITEMDVNDDGLPDDDTATREREVAAIYRKYVGDMLAHPAVTDVLTWGTADRYSWLNAGLAPKPSTTQNDALVPGAHRPNAARFRPKHPQREEVCLPFGDTYQPLPAFYALRDALDTRRA